MAAAKIKKGDSVVVIAGKDKGKQGQIAKVSPVTNKVVVTGLNMVKKATKPNQQTGEGGGHEARSPANETERRQLNAPLGLARACNDGREGRVISSDLPARSEAGR